MIVAGIHPLRILKIFKNEYELFCEYVTKGAMIRSRATWYEYGEKSNKYFLNLEFHRKSKSCIRKVYTEEGFVTSDPKRIMKEVEGSCSNLYKRDYLEASDDNLNSFLRPQVNPKLSDEDATLCEGKLTLMEFFTEESAVLSEK